MKPRIVAFLRRLFRSYSAGLRHAGYPDAYAGSANEPQVVLVQQQTEPVGPGMPRRPTADGPAADADEAPDPASAYLDELARRSAPLVRRPDTTPRTPAG